MPARQSQRGVGHEMRSAIHVNTVFPALEVRIPDLCETAVQREMATDLDRCLGFVPIGPAWPLELERPVIGNVDLLIRVINQERVRTEGKTPEPGRSSELVEIGGSEPGLIGALDHAARVDAVDARP